jgi:ketosteroid isomerase-like protein
MDIKDRRGIEDECRDLVVAWAHHTDQGRFEKTAELFADDATWMRGGKPLKGRNEILANLQKRASTTVVRHLVAGIRIEVKGADTAEGVTYYIVFGGKAESEPVKLPLPINHVFAMGETHDSFRLTPGGWRIAYRETRRLFEGEAGH